MTEDDGADARTQLAVERTMLAWWRTGLASLAVALAVGRLLPEISGEKTTWPLVTLGLAFALYACGLFIYGTARGASAARPTAGSIVVAGGGVALAVATIVLIAAA